MTGVPAEGPALHVPVLGAEVAQHLAPVAGGLYVDGTFGAGGYARALLAAANCRVVGLDRDPAAVARGEALAARLASETPAGAPRLTLIEGCFGDMAALVAARLPGVAVDGVALDLGVSSPQLDEAARGFSFRFDGPLDMRMGATGETAADLVATLDEASLADIIYRFGEERFSRRIARAIVAARAIQPITRTLALAEIVRRVVHTPPGSIDPATRTFQALRIAVNDELGELGRGLAGAERLLRPGGRLAVVSFHSLEDRVAKSFMRQRSGSSGQGSRHRPETVSLPPSLRLVTHKAIRPGAAESAANPRARSARLRVAERTAAPAWPDDRGVAA